MGNRVRKHNWFDEPDTRVNSHCSENPWDGTDSRSPISKAIAFNRARVLKWALIFWTVLVLLFIGAAGSIKADKYSTTKKTSKETKTVVKTELDEDVIEVAEEYAYLLEQLLYLSSDYCRYFEKLDDKASNENYKILANLCSKLSDKGQYENLSKLMVELDGLKQQLAERERRLEIIQNELENQSAKMKQAQANMKSLKLTSSLRSELEALDEQLERDVVWRVDQNRANREAVQNYVCEIVDDSLVNYIKSIAATYASRIHVLKDEDGKSTKVVIEMPDVPEAHVVYVPDAPAPPVPGTPHITPVAPVPGHFVGAAFYKELKDSVTVNSPDIQIYVTNAIGDLNVSGSPNRQISASYIIAISAEEPGSSEEFDQEVDLRIYPKQNKIYIESVAPPLTDPKMRVLKSRLELIVPTNNNLFVSNSSGNININDIGSNVVVKASSCNVELNRINGNAEIDNSSGAITVGKVHGSVIVQNRMGPVTLISCKGTIEVSNSFGDISVTNCDGNAVIRNTGAIAVDNHIGNLEITNRSGPVDVANLDGNLAAFNSFEPLRVKNISGTAKLINANADVEAVGIDGMASINNRFGQINASAIGGPVYIENKSGDINMLLANAMAGSSTLISNGGQVLLTISPRSNLFLTMESLNGDIDVTGFDAAVEEGNAGHQTALLTFGNGSSAMTVKSNNSRIVIKSPH